MRGPSILQNTKLENVFFATPLSQWPGTSGCGPRRRLAGKKGRRKQPPIACQVWFFMLREGGWARDRQPLSIQQLNPQFGRVLLTVFKYGLNSHVHVHVSICTERS
jgi:hypothetical protein